MSSPNIIKYPYDPTGLSEYNRVVGEILHLPRGSRERAYGLQAGPFYADSVIVKTVPGNVTLTRGVDYDLLYLYQQATKATGQPVMAVIYVFNEDILGQVSVDYQVVGGDFSSNVTAIQALIETLSIDERAITWDNVLDKPVTFPPAPHLHHVGDLYGMEAFIEALDRLTAAMLANDGDVDLTDIYARLDALDVATAQNADNINQVTIATNQNAANISQVANALQQLTTSINLKVAEIEAAMRTEVVLRTAGDLLPGRHHLFMAAVQGRLPTTVGLALDTVIHLSRRQIDIVPTVVVFDANTTTVRYGIKVGTGFNYKTRNALKVTLVEANVWEVSNDDD